MLRLIAQALVAVFVCVPAFAQSSLESYLRPPEFRDPRLSPDGTQLAALVPVNGRMNLATMDLATRKAVALTSVGNFDVVEFHWVGNDRLVFSLGQFEVPLGESYGGGGLFAIRRDGPEVRELSRPNEIRGMHFMHSVPGSADEIIVGARDRSLSSLDVYRLNVRTGRRTMLTFDQPPGETIAWTLDADLVPRAVLTKEESTLKSTAYYRSSRDAKWQALSSSDEVGLGGFFPVWIDPDGKSCVVLERAGTNTLGLHRFDLVERKLVEQLAAHPRYDMGSSSLVFDDERRLIGFQVEADRYQVAWIDENYARLQKTVDQALPNRVNKLQRRAAAHRTLVTSYSDRQPAEYFLLDEQKSTMEELFRSRRWLGPDDLVEMQPFLLKTRDGLEIPSYVFIPKSRAPGERLPTVVSVHGGPEVRADHWGYETLGAIEAQLLASRGYAVVLPNFRITPGLGAAIHRSGFRQLGRKMQEDHEDATRWAIEQGIADPARVCIYGGSYGGYAALMGVVKTPDLYRCSIAAFPVTDFESLMSSARSIYNYSKSTPAYYRRLIGDPDKEKDVFRAIAPARNAEKIKAPVFLIFGGADPIVPASQPEAMRRALARADKPVRVLERPEEGHGFAKLENRVEEFKQILEFLDTNIGLKAAR